MGVTHGVSELFPQACVVYTCPCGRRALRHGREAENPDGWLVLAGEGDEPHCACVDCVGADASTSGETK